MTIVAGGFWLYLVYSVYVVVRDFFRAVRKQGKHTVDKRV